MKGVDPAQTQLRSVCLIKRNPVHWIGSYSALNWMRCALFSGACDPVQLAIGGEEMKSANPAPTVFSEGRKLQIMDETVHDPYQSKGKLHEPTTCPQCHAVFHKGRWQWGLAPAGAHQAVCPACRRVQDKFPAGYLTISGPYALGHRVDLLHLIRNYEERAKAEHPLQRIMDINTSADEVLITTTDIHLARGLGEALHHAHQGDLDFHYEPDQYLLRLHWKR
jgi:hypothetical protein